VTKTATLQVGQLTFLSLASPRSRRVKDRTVEINQIDDTSDTHGTSPHDCQSA